MSIIPNLLFAVCISILGSIEANDVELGSRHTTIKYRFNESVNEEVKKLFEEATQAWMAGTCIVFEKDESNDIDNETILVTNDTSACYYQGRLLSINDFCADFGAIAHELGHALGLGHTHNRHDRDKYITINETNMKKDYEEIKEDWLMLNNITDANSSDAEPFPNFTVYKQQYEKDNNTVVYGAPYDFGSIMHYPPAGKDPAMIANDTNYQRTMGSHFISFTDRLAVNKHFNCSEKCQPDQSAKCKNHGFPDPRNCSICVCPSGYGGQLCDERPGGCGKNLTVTSEGWRNETKHVTNPEIDSGYYICTDWIKSPNGTRIEVRIAETNFGNGTMGCSETGIEIKTTQDQRLTGYRFCSDEDANTTLISNSNLVPIIYYSRERDPYLHAVLNYRIGKFTSKNIFGTTNYIRLFSLINSDSSHHLAPVLEEETWCSVLL